MPYLERVTLGDLYLAELFSPAAIEKLKGQTHPTFNLVGLKNFVGTYKKHCKDETDQYRKYPGMSDFHRREVAEAQFRLMNKPLSDTDNRKIEDVLNGEISFNDLLLVTNYFKARDEVIVIQSLIHAYNSQQPSQENRINSIPDHLYTTCEALINAAKDWTTTLNQLKFEKPIQLDLSNQFLIQFPEFLWNMNLKIEKLNLNNNPHLIYSPELEKQFDNLQELNVDGISYTSRPFVKLAYAISLKTKKNQ